MADEPSRLSEQILYKSEYITMEEYRDMIFARNLYNLENEYEKTNIFSNKGKSQLTESIQTILSVIPQYNRITSTGIAQNTYDAFKNDNSSPLAQIGLVMLGKQKAYGVAANLSNKYLPTIHLNQVLKGSMKGVFSLNENNTITVKDKDNTGFFDTVGNITNSLGFATYDIFGSPFDNNTTNLDLIKNTGKAQLNNFTSAINLNIYKQVDRGKQYDAFSVELVSLTSAAGEEIKDRKIVTDNKTYYYFTSPYIDFNFNDDAIANANADMRVAYQWGGYSYQMYAPSNEYINDNFGKTKKLNESTELNELIKDRSTVTIEDSENQIVWGRDGVNKVARTNIDNLRGTDDKEVGFSSDDKLLNDFNVRTGLLEYTRGLLNASGGQFVDITRKAFTKNKNVVGFQGSPLWSSNNKAYSNASGNDDKNGIRQHTILDQYDNFAKSIRFKGNVVYQGNPDSIINKTVLPRIHPTDDDLGNRNLMFSLENLAVGTIKRDTFGVIDDEYGTPIPLSEVGPFAGRLMWFPPYNLQINEVATAKYESTVMVGRNEPMYNYMNSERTAVLSFTLLVDYPEQLRNVEYSGKDKNKVIADFFAFGGNPLPVDFNITEYEKQIIDLEDEIEKIGSPDEQTEPASIDPKKASIFFQNDTPKEAQVDTIMDIMYDTPNHYEIVVGLESAQDGNGFGLNSDVFYREGLLKYPNTNPQKYNLDLNTNELQNFSQYTLAGFEDSPLKDQLGICRLNQYLFDVYSNEENRKYYSITITGEASKLYLSDNEKAYNEALGDRRVRATAKLIRSRLKILFPDLGDRDIEIIEVPSTGSVGNSSAGASPDNIALKSVKAERTSTITIARNTKSVEPKDVVLNQEQIDNIDELRKQIAALDTKIKKLKNQQNQTSNHYYNERDENGDAILNGYESISDDKFYPTFHSQTPEDFHRRLTFLQQCTRQGAAKRYDVVEENGQLRAKNSVFGRQPICILRVGDFFYTKVVINNVTIDYDDTTWDMNPEGFGLQPMIANVTLQMNVIGGQSLKGPIDALQNAVTFNYYANSNFTDKGVYKAASDAATLQNQYMFGVDGKSGLVNEKQAKLNDAYENKTTEGDK